MKNIFICFVYLLISISVQAQENVRQVKIKKGQKYLNFPVSNAKELAKTRIKYKGKVLDEFTIGLADENIDFWTFFDVSAYQGKTITVEVDNGKNNGKGIDKIFADAGFPGQDSLYKEKLRPQVHFSSRRGWLNDPNGLIYHNGEYHLYYQHNPYGWNWGNMHWGHAVSKDLVRWRELPDALYTSKHEDMAFSGSAVVDVNNTSGFRKNGVNPLIAVYTSTGRGEGLALSYDNGRTFNDYEGNPILKHKGRDPKVFWYEPGKHWVMIVWDEGKTKKMSQGQDATIYQHLIYTSPNLKEWTYQSGVAGFFECPELFQLPIENEGGMSKWVMYDASGRYVIGDFDGKHFTIEQSFKQYDHGGNFYASQTYNNAPNNRRIQIGWGRDLTTKGMPFNQSMTFPTELKLKRTFDGLRLCPTPIKEIESLYKNKNTFENKLITSKNKFIAPLTGDAFHLTAEFEKGDAHTFGLNINGYELAYSHLQGIFNKATYSNPDSENFKIEAIVDKGIIEVFVNDGELYYVAPLKSSPESEKKVEAFVRGPSETKTVLKSLRINELQSSWMENPIKADTQKKDKTAVN